MQVDTPPADHTNERQFITNDGDQVPSTNPPHSHQAPTDSSSNQVVIVNEDDPFDLDQVISNYDGRNRIIRLHHIATLSPSLAGPALTSALGEVKMSTLDVNSYENIYHLYRQHIRALETGELKDPIAMQWFQSVVLGKGSDRNDQQQPQLVENVDRAWIERTRREAQNGIDKLEVELKGYTTNLIKESIRMGHRDLARFQVRVGDPHGAVRSFTKSRDYCTTPQHVLEMCLGVIEVALELCNYPFMRSYVVKAETALDALSNAAGGPPGSSNNRGGGAASKGSSENIKTRSFTNATSSRVGATDPASTSSALPPLSADAGGDITKQNERKATQERLTIALGVAYLGGGSYDLAARSFVNGFGKVAQSLGMSHFIPPTDIALYAVLTGLATFSRSELKTQLLENSNLRPIIDLEPYLRELVTAFYESRFKDGLDLLQKHRTRHILDIHLTLHLKHLEQLIGSSALLTYFTPYSNVSLTRYSAAFGWPEEVILKAVIELIKSGKLQARVDLINRVIVSCQPSIRVETFNHALEEGEKILRREMASQFRLKLIRANILVKAPKHHDHQHHQQQQHHRHGSSNVDSTRSYGDPSGSSQDV